MKLNYKFCTDKNSGAELAEKGLVARSPTNILDDARKGKQFGVSVSMNTIKSVKVVLFSEMEAYRLSASDMRQEGDYKVVENHSGGFFKVNKSQSMTSFIRMITNYIESKGIIGFNDTLDFTIEFSDERTKEMFEND